MFETSNQVIQAVTQLDPQTLEVTNNLSKDHLSIPKRAAAELPATVFFCCWWLTLFQKPPIPDLMASQPIPP